MSAVNPAEIARVAYEARRMYGRALGEQTQPSWEEAERRQQEDAIAGVEAVLSGEARSGLHLLDAWVRRGAGFPSLETLLPDYQQLGVDDRRKILLFRAVVLALVDGPCNGFCHDEKCANLEDHDCHLDTCLSRFGVPPGLWQGQTKPRTTEADPPPAPLYC
jgi:hypothetical protein